ncbi:hypothetical protein AA106556_0192 [Neokomagataea tanensis NBRC 106556]|uniref:DUF1150 domain-containing protein n=1 Tax=Neokomagataea tanensis NBRC 106556 TaxID=1223519 RepID=A0ABQ0QGD6_9PROT|nr:hypothetical protein AA106556_0192 [Neokomagataea tanensis NBRC 106556]
MHKPAEHLEDSDLTDIFDSNQPAEEALPSDLRHITDQQLRVLGMSRLAYVRAGVEDGEAVMIIHAADGTPMAVADDEESAMDAILEHEMIPTMLQ